MKAKLHQYDYITIDTITHRPTCSLDTIYHESSVVEEYNIQLEKEKAGYKFVRMTELPKKLQKKYIKYLTQTK